MGESLGKRTRRYFISGLIIFLPLSLTVYLLVLMFNWADGLFGRWLAPYFAREFGFYIKGISLIICVFIIIFIGFFATNFLGKKIHHVFESFILRLPFFKQVYPPLKEMAQLLFSDSKPSFKDVVMVEYPRKGMYSLGFLVNDTPKRITDKVQQKEMLNVFIPTSPSPFSGFVVLVPKNEVIFTDIKIEEAIKFFVSDGVVNPPEISSIKNDSSKKS